MKKSISCLVLASLLGAAVYSLRENPSERIADHTGSTLVLPLSKRQPVQEAEPAEPLSRRELVAALPETPPVLGLHGAGKTHEATMDVYRQLGAMDGEAALDFLMDQYGAGQPGLSYAMGYALSGWMENDLEGALHAFKGFLRVSDGFLVTNFKDPYLFSWKGRDFHSGLM